MESSFQFDVPDLTESEGQGRATETRYVCVDCEVFSPAVESNFTLISSRFGWRLHRYRNADSGQVKMDWRCPRCFRLFREERRRRALESLPPLPPSFSRSR